MLKNLSLLRPWSFYSSLLGNIWEVDQKQKYNEISFFVRSVTSNFRVWIVFRYLSILFLSGLIPLWGSLIWFFCKGPQNIIIHPAKRNSEKIFENNDILVSEEKYINSKERWIFVNGIGVDFEIAKLNASHIAELFQKTIKLIYKPTYGILYDLAETIGGRTFDIPSTTDTMIQDSLYKSLMNNEVDKVVLILHSQGSVIACNAIRKMIKKGSVELKESIERKLEVYSFGSVADSFFLFNKGPVYENFVNREDFISYLSLTKNMFVEDISSKEKKVDKNEESFPRTFVNKDPNKSGHLLSAHYLTDFAKGNYVAMEGEEKSRLFSYLAVATS